jgi:prepilin-type N-terminal cleavage/methylation domain-containing protein
MADQKAFTIIELVISIFILSVAVVGVYGAFSLAVILSSDASNRLTAAYLVQEGQEIARNIRDTNWLEMNAGTGTSWLDGNLDNCSSGCEADYINTSMAPWVGKHLNKNDSGFYIYDNGFPESKFKRKITIAPVESVDYAVLVKVEVSWDEKANLLYSKQTADSCITGYNCVESEVTLYNWYNYTSAVQPD